jgi:hypothetical protein
VATGAGAATVAGADSSAFATESTHEDRIILHKTFDEDATGNEFQRYNTNQEK